MDLDIIRIIISLAGLAFASYFDIYKERNVPSIIPYAMILAGIILNLAGFDLLFFINAAAVAIIVFALGWLIYRTGQLGGADVLIMAALALLLPQAPQALFSPASKIPFPPIVSIFILSGVFAIIGVALSYGPRLLNELKAGKAHIRPMQAITSLIIFVSYAAILYSINQIHLLPLPLTILLFALAFIASFLLMFKDHLSEGMIEWVPFERIDDEDVLAIEKLDAGLVSQHKLARVLTPKEKEKLKSTGLQAFPIFKGMPPFIPYILLAVVVVVLVGNPFALFPVSQ